MACLRGGSKLYEHNDILDKATDLFWQKGFQATSMRDVQQVLNMRPGSLYARFAGKAELFNQVIDHYASRLQARLQAAVAQSDVLAAMQAFFEQELLTPPTRRYQRQCLLVNAMSQTSKLNETNAAALEAAIGQLRNAFCAVIKALQTQGVLATGTDVRQAGSWLQTQFIGLRHMAYVAQDDSQVQFFIEKLMLDLQGAWPANRAPSS